jgi:hypothetical protein
MSYTMMPKDKPNFNYKAFAKDIKGELYGVGGVVNRVLEDPNWHSRQMREFSDAIKT